MAMFTDRQPLARPNIGHFGAMRRRGMYDGEPGVRYDEGGRLVYPNQPPNAALGGPMSRLFWRRGGAQPQPAVPDNFRYRPWNRRVVADPSAAPIFPRRFFGVQAANRIGSRLYQPPVVEELPYTPASRLMGLPAASPAGTSGDPVTRTTSVTSPPATTTMAKETIIIEEMRVYEEKPCFFLPLVLGILMIGAGVANITFCFDYLKFCYLWTGVALVVFAIVCKRHQGDYVANTKKTWLVIAVGLITTLLEVVAVWFVTESLCYNAIEWGEVETSEYIWTWRYRYNYYNITPLVTINGDYSFTYNIFVCFSLNAFVFVLLMFSMIVLTITLLVIDRFYNSHYVISRKVEPFCEPGLFNPWGQCSLGQAIMVVGCFIGASQHGNENRNWFLLYSPTWSGLFAVSGGIGAALSLKTSEKDRRWEHWLALVLEGVSLAFSSVSIAFMIYDLIDNLTSLSAGGVMLNTQWNKNLLFFNVIFKAIGMIVSTVNLFYSGMLILRIMISICSNLKKPDEDNDDIKHILYESADTAGDNPEGKTVEKSVADDVTAATTYKTRGNNLPVFSPYKPMGMRSFYA